MTAPSALFTCSICGEPSADICIYCTKDTCRNHRCVRCKRCSDCCQCDVPLSAEEAEQALMAEAAAQQAVTDHQNGLHLADPDVEPIAADEEAAVAEEPAPFEGPATSEDVEPPRDPEFLS